MGWGCLHMLQVCVFVSLVLRLIVICDPPEQNLAQNPHLMQRRERDRGVPGLGARGLGAGLAAGGGGGARPAPGTGPRRVRVRVRVRDRDLLNDWSKRLLLQLLVGGRSNR